MWGLSRRKKPASIAKLETAALSNLTPAFKLNEPAHLASPLILASPHSGRIYPDGFLAQTKLELAQLRLGEDCYVDRIIQPLCVHGIPVLAARFPRCFVDVNRKASEWPPETRALVQKRPFEISPRARAGLGVVPTRITQELNIYGKTLTPFQIQNRLDALYHPYHKALTGLIETTQAEFGTALLLDCHSMPGQAQSGIRRPDFILGDRYGESCRAKTIDIMEIALKDLGYSTARNAPYAGGHITAHYGRPHTGVQALQIEVNKDLYLNPDTLEEHEGMAELMRNMENAILYLAAYITPAANIAAQ